MRRSVLAVVNPEEDKGPKPAIRRDPDGTSYEVHGISIKKAP